MLFQFEYLNTDTVKMLSATRLLLVLLATITVYLGFVSATIEYNPAAYRGDLRSIHDKIFKETELLIPEAVHNMLCILRDQRKPLAGPSEVDELIKFGEVKIFKCTKDHLRYFQSSLAKYAEYKVNLQPYLAENLRGQIALCYQKVLNMLIDDIQGHDEKLVDALSKSYLKFDPELKGVNRAKRVEVHADFIETLMGPMDVYIRDSGSMSFREFINLRIEELRNTCLLVDEFRRRSTSLIDTMDEIRKWASMEIFTLAYWLFSCSDHLRSAWNINPEVEQLMKHQSHRKDLEIWNVSVGDNQVVPKGWRDAKLEIYNQQVAPAEILDAEVTWHRLEWLVNIQEKDILGIFKSFSSNFEQELLSVSHLTEDKCKDVFPYQFKYLMERHASEPNIAAYLENYYNRQLATCMFKLEANVEATISELELQTDMAVARHIYDIYKSLLDGREPEPFSKPIIVLAVSGYIHLKDAHDPDLSKKRLKNVKDSCKLISVRLDRYKDTMLAIEERELMGVLDEDLVGKLRLVQFCQTITTIPNFTWIFSPKNSEPSPAEGSSRKRPGDDIRHLDKGKGKVKQNPF